MNLELRITNLELRIWNLELKSVNWNSLVFDLHKLVRIMTFSFYRTLLK